MGQGLEKDDLFDEEKKELISKEKEIFIETLADISKRVKGSKPLMNF